ncbi:MAG TPA: hypothetical protein PLH70_08780 [Bacteroidales bacterium]|nr:hypothetical protein [Bacteroidales bacterium]HOH22503.1 hypothetical protein [Bacteroidales bacterium]HPB57895.1 hypothetical protein [Bacteroidales bacterium]HPZ02993.1 hypothetical protein [Bacteroidales bacterium]HQB75878.1 hypothetical protein [Bacteroidales bacterium]
MKKINNLAGSLKKYFLLSLFISTVIISYGRTVNQKQNSENQGSSITTPNLIENTSVRRGFRLVVDVGYQYQFEPFFTNINRVKFNIAGNYQFNSYMSMGVGLGVRYYHNHDNFLFPLTYNFRARLLESKFSPYFSIGVGYTFLTSEGPALLGLSLNPEFGLSYRVSEKVELHLTFGYEMQNVAGGEIDYVNYNFIFPTVHTRPIVYNLGAFSTSFGIAF